MGNIEQCIEEKQTFNHIEVLDKYIFNENMLFVEAITQCFLREQKTD